MGSEHDIDTLNGLIETTLDSSDGYAEAANDADSDPLIEMFRVRSIERAEVASSLQQCVRKLGGEPEDEGTVLASAHRMFVNLRSNLTSGHDKTVVDEVERGEDHIMAKFEDAIKDVELSAATKSSIASAYASVRSGHDQMSELKQAFHQ